MIEMKGESTGIVETAAVKKLYLAECLVNSNMSALSKPGMIQLISCYMTRLQPVQQLIDSASSICPTFHVQVVNTLCIICLHFHTRSVSILLTAPC